MHEPSDFLIRQANIDDLVIITDIYNQAIAAGKCTCDMDLIAVEDHLAWFYSHDRRTPIFVYQQGDTICGFAYLSPYRSGRRAVADICEISYYVDFTHHRQGIGSKLVHHCIAAARECQYTHMLALLLSCNKASIAVLEKIGFQLWGSLPDIATFDGKERYSHLYYGISLD